MLRRYSHAKGNEQGGAITFSDHPCERNEFPVKDEGYDAICDAIGEPAYINLRQFSTRNSLEWEYITADMDQARAWLGEHSTGPWSWHEAMSNNGHHVDRYVYIERLTDQRRFHKEFGAFFDYQGNTTTQLEHIATLRGVLPPLTAREDFRVWRRQNAGYRLVTIDDSSNPPVVRVTFTIRTLHESFVKIWGNRFTKIEDSNSYVGKLPVRQYGDVCQEDFLTSLSDNEATTYVYDSTISKLLLIPRYPETQEAILQDWSNVFAWDHERRAFVAPLRTDRRPRHIPDDFMAYLRGERDDYNAPHTSFWAPTRHTRHAAPVDPACAPGG